MTTTYKRQKLDAICLARHDRRLKRCTPEERASPVSENYSSSISRILHIHTCDAGINTLAQNPNDTAKKMEYNLASRAKDNRNINRTNDVCKQGDTSSPSQQNILERDIESISEQILQRVKARSHVRQELWCLNKILRTNPSSSRQLCYALGTTGLLCSIVSSKRVSLKCKEAACSILTLCISDHPLSIALIPQRNLLNDITDLALNSTSPICTQVAACELLSQYFKDNPTGQNIFASSRLEELIMSVTVLPLARQGPHPRVWSAKIQVVTSCMSSPTNLFVQHKSLPLLPIVSTALTQSKSIEVTERNGMITAIMLFIEALLIENAIAEFNCNKHGVILRLANWLDSVCRPTSESQVSISSIKSAIGILCKAKSPRDSAAVINTFCKLYATA